MEAKIIRLCVECRKQHDTGIENRLTGEFEPIEKCIDCLMSKCSFEFEKKQIRLDDVVPVSYDQMQKQICESMLKIMKREYGSCQIGEQ